MSKIERLMFWNFTMWTDLSLIPPILTGIWFANMIILSLDWSKYVDVCQIKSLVCFLLLSWKFFIFQNKQNISLKMNQWENPSPYLFLYIYIHPIKPIRTGALYVTQRRGFMYGFTLDHYSLQNGPKSSFEVYQNWYHTSVTVPKLQNLSGRCVIC